MPVSKSEVLVGRRYLERGFVDAGLKLLVRNAEHSLPVCFGQLAKHRAALAIWFNSENDDIDVRADQQVPTNLFG